VAATKSGGATTLFTMGTDGRVIDRVALADLGEIYLLAVDHSGTNFLITNSNGLARLSLTDTTPVHIGPPVAQASWW